MKIYVQMKTVETRRRALERHPYELPNQTYSLRSLIQTIVLCEVERYNAKDTDPAVCRFLSDQEIKDSCEAGRVSFGRIFSMRKADPQKAVSTAMQGFEDGLFKVVWNDSVLEDLDTPILLQEEDTLTFIRLTFLTGAYW